MSKKLIVLDTNVFIHDPECIFRFEDNDVVIPLVVIQELDNLKKREGEIGFAARKTMRVIDSFLKEQDALSGIKLPGGGKLYVDVIDNMEDYKADDIVIHAAKLRKNEQDSISRNPVQVILVSKDTAVRIKGKAKGLVAQDYLFDKVNNDPGYGRVVDSESKLSNVTSNQYLFKDNQIWRYTGAKEYEPVKRGKTIDGVIPKNIDQECAINALVDPEIQVVVLAGGAGSGKTFLALAVGLHQTVMTSDALYDQTIVARPIMPMGNDLGYLPGELEDKLAPWMQPIFDNLEVYIPTAKDAIKQRQITNIRGHEYLIESGSLKIEPLTYIRGRSLPNRYVIIDEAQNLRPLEVKTIITRCGENTKIVFTGDLNQIDANYLDANSCGLAHLIDKFRNEKNFCYLNMTSTVRSKVAEQGARLL